MKKLHDKDKGDGIEQFSILSTDGKPLKFQEGVSPGIIKINNEIEKLILSSEKKISHYGSHTFNKP
jgi:hypothetical protein